MIKSSHLSAACSLVLILFGCWNPPQVTKTQGTASRVPSASQIDGWILEPVSPNDPMTRTMTKDGNELTIIYSDNPNKDALDTFKEMIPAIKSRGAESIEVAGLSGYMEVTQLKANNSTLPSLMVAVTLQGPSEILQISFKGEGNRDETKQFVREAVNEFHSKWKMLYHDK